MRFLRKLPRCLLVESLSRWRHQNSFGFRISGFGFFTKRLDRGKNRLRLHHHPLPSAKRRGIYYVMLVRGPIAPVMNVEFENSLFLRAFHDALAQWRVADFREQRDDVDLHRERNIERPTSNVQRRILQTPQRLTAAL